MKRPRNCSLLVSLITGAFATEHSPRAGVSVDTRESFKLTAAPGVNHNFRVIKMAFLEDNLWLCCSGLNPGDGDGEIR